MKREVVIHDHALPETINEQPNPVVRVWTDVRGLEESLDYKGKLADGCNSGQEIAIPKPALFDILRLDLALEDGKLSLHELRSPLPLYILRVTLRPKRVLSRREILINELVIAIQRLLNIQLLVGHNNWEVILGDKIGDLA